MWTWSLLSLILMYPLVLAGDGCILIAIALVATTGGNPWTCGAAFAFFHAFYSISGILLASEIAEYSETLGEVIVLLGALILLKHFVHHRLHHGSHGDCSCEHHPLKPISTFQMVSTAGALSIHAFAAGPIIRQMSGITDVDTIMVLLLTTSALIGILVSLIVRVGDSRREGILRFLDSLPGVVTGVLSGVSFYSLFHILEHAFGLSLVGAIAFIFIAVLASCSLGYWIHTKASFQLVQLSTKAGKR